MSQKFDETKTKYSIFKCGWSIKQDIEMESNIWYASGIFDIRDKNLADRAKQEGRRATFGASLKYSSILTPVSASPPSTDWNLLTKQS